LNGVRLFLAALYRTEALGAAFAAVPAGAMLACGILVMCLPYVLGRKRLVPEPAAVWCNMIDEAADLLKLGKKQRLELYQSFFDELRRQMGTAIDVKPRAAVADALASAGAHAALPETGERKDTI
jgi:hypothetical protein